MTVSKGVPQYVHWYRPLNREKVDHFLDTFNRVWQNWTPKQVILDRSGFWHMVENGHFWPLFGATFKPFSACFGPFLTSFLAPKWPFLDYLTPKWSFLTSYLKGPFESTPGLTHVFDKRPQKGYPKSRSFSCMWRILRVLFQAVTRPTLIKR